MLSALWKAALASRATPRHLLLTVVFSEEALFTEPHPALTPRAMRAASGLALPVETGTGAVIPFAATITAWPTIRRELSIAERRAPVASVQVSLTRDASFPHEAVGPGTPPPVWARLDLWCPGIPLGDAFPLLAGPVTQAAYDYRRGGVTLTLEDGDTQRSVEFPAGQLTISADDFPDAPDQVLGQAHRQIIWGPFPYPIPCIPISKDGQRQYLCEPAAVMPPTAFQVGGSEVRGADRPVVTVARFATDPTRTYTELIFPTAIANLALSGSASASGGVGLPVDSAPITLLRDIGGYRLSARAERDFRAASALFNFSVFQNRNGGVMELVRDRILPQTDLAMTLRLGKVETFRLGRPSADTGRHLAIGHGLWAYVPTTRQPGTSEAVFNAIEVRFRRNTIKLTVDGTLTRNAFVVDSRYQGRLGARLLKSEKRYGRRFLSIDAADLVDDGTGGVPASVVALGELAAHLNAFPPHTATYAATWIDGMQLDLNDQVFLTDPNEDFDETPVRVVAWELSATGPRLTFADLSDAESLAGGSHV